MVKSADRRKAKYQAKIDPDVMRARILAQQTDMVTNAEGAFANLAQIENEVKACIMNLTVTVPSIMVPAYMNVGRQLWKLQQKFSGTTYAAEAQLVLTKWQARGLIYTPLKAIALLFGFTYTY